MGGSAESVARAMMPPIVEPGARARGDCPRVLFLGCTYAGHHTRFLNLVAHSRLDSRIRPRYHCVTGWSPGGSIERLRLLPAGLRGRARSVLEAAAFASFPRPDVIWSSVGDIIGPYLWSQAGRFRRPVVFDLDWTFEQQELLAPIYFDRPSRRGVLRALGLLRERVIWKQVTVFTAWSAWVADSLRRQGVDDSRIRVLPPGVDLEQWKPRPELRRAPDQRVRLLFVGGDFERKGGKVLLDVFRSRFAGRCDLDIVTRDEVMPSPGVRVHRAEPNSPLLRELVAQADLFVLPTRAECFGIATIEAMASGLPVIVGNVGGAPDIVDDGRTGWLIEPTAIGLARALEHAVTRRECLPAIGRQARAVAEQRFDGARNDVAVIDLLLAEAGRAQRAARHWDWHR